LSGQNDRFFHCSIHDVRFFSGDRYFSQKGFACFLSLTKFLSVVTLHGMFFEALDMPICLFAALCSQFGVSK